MNKTYFKNLKRAVELFPNMFVQAQEVVSNLGSKDIPDESEKKINSVQMGDLRRVNGTWRTCVDPERNIWSPYKESVPTKTPTPLPRNVALEESDTCKSFDAWIDVGRGVRRGEKSQGRDSNGLPMFFVSQTEPTKVNVPPQLREDFDEDDWTKQK